LEKEEQQDDAPFVFLFPVVKLFSGFGMVLLFSRGEALFPAAMIVWLWWLKESFFQSFDARNFATRVTNTARNQSRISQHFASAHAQESIACCGICIH
jgi:hypothetical protein